MKLKNLFFIVIVLLFLSACGKEIEPKEPLVEIYCAALDSLMELDPGLNSEMEYIAIDMSNFEDLDENDKNEIMNYFNDKYNVEVMDATFEQLKEKGLFDEETLSLDGVLLSKENLKFNDKDHIFFEGTKYRSGLGAIGVETVIHYKDNKWQVKESRIIWIS